MSTTSEPTELTDPTTEELLAAIRDALLSGAPFEWTGKNRFVRISDVPHPAEAVEPEVILTLDEADALREALEEYMRHDDLRAGNYRAYKDRWNAADIALVPLRGGPMSSENRRMEAPRPDPHTTDVIGRGSDG